jgi:hypothetical protein
MTGLIDISLNQGTWVRKAVPDTGNFNVYQGVSQVFQMAAGPGTLGTVIIRSPQNQPGYRIRSLDFALA